MAKASDTNRYRVLHIRPQATVRLKAGPRRSTFEELLAGLPTEMDWCEDVYRGLARLLRPSSDPPETVIVCLDGLGPAEFEFFSIVSRLRRDLKVYVYAATRAESRIARAVELGAAGPVTSEILTELASGEPVAMTEGAFPRAPARVTDKSVSPANAQHGHASVDHATPTDAFHDNSAAPMDAPEPIESPRTEHEGPRPVRVPWLRYADRPVRTAPPREKPSPQAQDSGPQTPDLPRSYEPLLTEEELRALMSDDIAPITPDARDSGDDERIRGVS